MLATIIQIDAWDPVAAATATIRLASHDDPSVCHLNGQIWWPAIRRLPALRYDFFSGAFDGQIGTPSSTVEIGLEDFPTFARLILADGRVRIWTGNLGDAFGSYTLRFDGIVSAQPAISNLSASIEFAVDDRWLDEPLLDLFLGVGGVEGEAGQKGTPKPLAVGQPRYAPGVMIDSTNMVLMLSGYGPVQGTATALERLVRFGSSTGNYASLSALLAASIPAGGWGTCNALGLVRHGAKLAGLVSYLLSGDNGGVDGWVRKPGQLIKRLCEIRGYVGKVSEASVDALDAARPWNLSAYLSDQVTIREIVQRIAASVNAAAGVSWLGQLFVVPIGIGTPAGTLRSDGTTLPVIGDVEQVPVQAPYWRMAVQAQRTWAVHQQSDIAYDVDPALTAANAALAQLVEIASDGLLTPDEKGLPIERYATITGEQAGIDAQATAYGITTEKTNYDNEVSSLTAYLATLNSPVAWNSFSGNTTVVGTTWRAHWRDVELKKQALLDKINELGNNKRNVTGGGNRVPFSKFEAGWATYWANLFNPSGVVSGLTTGTYLNRRYLQMTVSSPGAGYSPSVGLLTPGFFPVTAGERIAVQTAIEATSVMTGTHSLVIHYYNASGVQVSAPTVASVTGAQTWGTVVGAFMTVPAGAVKAQLEMYFQTGGAGACTGTLIEPMVTQASQDQTILPAYSPGTNANDGATLGAPNSTDPVGSITAGDVAGTVKSGGGVANNQVGTLAVQVGALATRTGTQIGSGVTGSNAFVYVGSAISLTITDATASVIISAGGAQNYYLTVPDHEFAVTIDGTKYGWGSSGGASDYQAVVAAGAIVSLPVGTYSIRMRWRGGDPGITLTDALMTVDAAKRNS